MALVPDVLFPLLALQGSTGARELSDLAARLLASLLAELKSGTCVGRSTPSEEEKRGGAPSADDARSAVARLAFQVKLCFCTCGVLPASSEC